MVQKKGGTVLSAASLSINKVLDGMDSFLYIRFSEFPDGRNMSSEPNEKTKYIGVVSTKENRPPSDPARYAWTAFKGADGEKTFLWVRYSEQDGGKPKMESNPSAKTQYMGVYSGPETTAPTDATKYRWVKTKGEQGESSYLHVRYSDYADGTGFYEKPKRTTMFIGVAVTVSEKAPANKEAYDWAEFGVNIEFGGRNYILESLAPVVVKKQDSRKWINAYPSSRFSKDWPGYTGFAITTIHGYTSGTAYPGNVRMRLVGLKGTSRVYEEEFSIPQSELRKKEFEHSHVFIIPEAASTANSYLLEVYSWTENMELEIDRIKLERGNRPTDWSGAPEDVSSEMMEIKKESASLGVLIQKLESGKASTAELQALATELSGYVKSNTSYGGVKITDQGVLLDSTNMEVILDQRNGFLVKTKSPDQIILQVDKDGKFIINASNLNTDVGKAQAEAEKAKKAAEEANKTKVKSVEMQYYLSSSTTILSGGKWESVAPEWTPNKFMWNRTKTVYGDGSIVYTPSEKGTCIAGAKGQDGIAGKDGVGIVKTTIDYAISDSGSQKPQSGWSSSVPQLTKGRYLWTRTVWKYSDSSEEVGYSVTYISKDGNSGKDGIPGKDGVGIEKTVIEYASSKSGTIKPASGWTSTIPQVPEGDFLWTRTTWTYTDSTSEQGFSAAKMGESGEDGRPGKDGVGLKSTSVSYTLSSNGESAPSAGWTNEVPKLTKGLYLWTKTVWVYTDSSSKTGYSVTYISKDGNSGQDGLPGKDGVGIEKTVIEYTTSTSGVNRPVANWGPSIPTVKEGHFLWTRTTWTYTDGSQEQGFSVAKMGVQGDKGKDGIAGKDGVGVKSTTITYGLSDSESTQPSSWTSSVPSLLKGKYLWTKTVWEYTDNTNETGYIKTYIAKDGNSGKDGIPGKDGVGIKSTTITYTSSTSGTVQPTGNWTNTIPSVPAGQYLWTKTVWTYTDNTSETGYSVAKMGEKGGQGVQGPPGKDGQATYTWIKYADSPTSGMSDSPTNKKYIGLAYNKTTKTESTNYSDYQWSLVKGSDGIPGKDGKDGKPTYTWIVYADDIKGNGISKSADGKGYMGIAYNKDVSTPTLTASLYEWVELVGALEIGGRNYIRETSVSYRPLKIATWHVEVGNRVKVSDMGLSTGDYISLRAYIKISDKEKYGSMVRLNFYKADDTYTQVSGNIIQPSKEGYSTVTTKMPAGYTELGVSFDRVGAGNSEQINIEYRELKLEKGNRPTDWSPAPEDTTQEILDGIDGLDFGGTNLLKNSKTKLKSNGYLISTLHFGETKPKDGETYTISIKGSMGSDVTHFPIYNSGGTLQVVSLAERDKNSKGVYTKTFKWKDYGSNTHINIYNWPRASTGTSEIEWVKIESGNKATDWSPAPEDVYEKIDSIEIGGTNLLRDTKDFSDNWVKRGSSTPKDDIEKGFKYVEVLDTWKNYIYQDIPLVEQNVVYSLSFYAKAPRKANLEIKDDGINNFVVDIVEIDGVDWKRYSVLFSQPKDITKTKLVFLTRQSETPIAIKKIKLEKGNKPSDWSPAPEDSRVYKAWANSIDGTKDFTRVEPRENLLSDEEGKVYTRDGKDRGEFINDPQWDLAGIIESHGLDTDYTISFDLRTSKAGNVSIYMQNGNGSRYDLLGTNSIRATTSWNRYSIPARFKDGSDKTETRALLAFFGQYGTGVFPHVRNIKVEVGKEATMFVPSKEQAPERAAFQFEGLSATDSDNPNDYTWGTSQKYLEIINEVNLGGKVDSNEYENDREEIQTSLGDKASKDELKEIEDLANQIQSEYEEFIKDGGRYEADLKSLEKRISAMVLNLGDKIAEFNFINKYIKLGEEGLLLGDSTSLMNILISDKRISFFDGGKEVAYMEGQEFRINRGTILESLQVGSHKMEQVDANSTIFTFIS